mgnify:FL=1
MNPMSAIGVLVSLSLFAIGMTSSLADLTYLWRRPWLLVKSLFAMYVLVPAFAIGMVTALELPPGTGAAVVILAVCAGAPLLPRKLMKVDADPDLIVSLVVTTSLLSVVTVPLSLRWLDRYLPFEALGDPSQIARLIVLSFLAPFLAGMIVRALAPRFANRVDDPMIRVAGLGLLACTLLVVMMRRTLVLDLGWDSFFAFVALVGFSITAGHRLGGPTSLGRTSLALACASRHVGLALLIAANARGPRALSLVAGYVLASAAVSMLDLAARRDRAA